jgi:hypothetical protein
MSTTELLPRASASAAPCALLRTSMSVLPKRWRMSNTGTSVRRKLDMWKIGAQRHLRRAERHHRRRVAVHHGEGIGALRVDLAVDEPLEIRLARVAVLHVRLEVVRLDVGARHELRRERAGRSRKRSGRSGCRALT